MGELLSPIIKVPLELAQNKVWYFNRPITDYPGETEEFLRTDMPAWLAYIGRQVRVLNEIHRLTGFKERGAESPPQPNVPQRLIRVGTGIRIFKMDMRRAMRIKKSELMDEVKKLNIGMSRAKTFGRKKEMQRILKVLAQHKQTLKELPYGRN